MTSYYTEFCTLATYSLNHKPEMFHCNIPRVKAIDLHPVNLCFKLPLVPYESLT